MTARIKYAIGEVLYWTCAELWAVSRGADCLWALLAKQAAALQEEWIRERRERRACPWLLRFIIVMGLLGWLWYGAAKVGAEILRRFQ